MKDTLIDWLFGLTGKLLFGGGLLFVVATVGPRLIDMAASLGNPENHLQLGKLHKSLWNEKVERKAKQRSADNWEWFKNQP